MAWGTLTVNERNDGFLLDGRPWFWVADTCWSAFTSITLEDWDYYLARRAEQGINVLQINTLPQWDRCRPDLGIYPYASDDGVAFDWATPNQEYWDRAREMCRMAMEHGIRPALVLMWCNFVPGTWGALIAERTGATVMPLEEVSAHMRRVIEALDEFDPVYVVTGDTDWKSEECFAHYEAALATVCELAPSRLRTMHINRANRTIPEQFVDRLDFYMYQPGHNAGAQDEAWKLPEDFRASYPGKPLVNAEPCYEMMGASRNVYHRFSAQECRASAWAGLLAGATAGVTYGAHGIWNWQTAQSQGSVLGEGFDMPFRWQEALQFPGVWDFGGLPALLDALGARAIEPAQDVLDDARAEIRVGRTPGDAPRYLVYLPHTTAVRLSVELAGYTARAIDLEGKRIAHLPLAAADGATRVAQHPFTSDALVVIEPAR